MGPGTVFTVVLAFCEFSDLALQEERAGEAPREPLHSVSVTGIGSVRARPDRVVLTLGVRSEAKAATDAMAKANEGITSVLARLKEHGVPSSQIETQLLLMEPMPPEKHPEGPAFGGPPGYIATHILRVTLTDVDKTGEILDLAVRGGANVVGGVQFELGDREKLLDQARREAMAHARRDAAQLAESGGSSLLEVLTIQEDAPAPWNRPSLALAVRPEAAMSVEPGMEQVTVTVHVTWRLQGGIPKR